MKHLIHCLCVLQLLLCSVECQGQELQTQPNYSILSVDPFVSVTKDKVQNARRLVDLNPRYEQDWIEEYLSVSLVGLCDAEKRTIMTSNDSLTVDQKSLILQADYGEPLSFDITYYPDNGLSLNDEKHLSFDIYMLPDKSAMFPSDEQGFDTYIQENILSTLPPNAYQDYDITVITFTVSADGSIRNTTLFAEDYNSSPGEEIDNLILQEISSMPNWIPAAFEDGTCIAQDFAFLLGNHDNCVTHMLTIKE